MSEAKEAEFSEDVFESMLNGSFEENVEGEADAAEDLEEEDNEDQEDTDQEEESEDDEELDEAGDGELDEDSEDSGDDEEEDTLVETNDSDDTTDTDEVADEVTEDSADTEETSDGKAPDTDTVDYKAFYDTLANAEFVVNGKKVKGFTDPQKIIQSQQMAGGFSEKMAGFKQYRPFMTPLKERGMLDDQAKFDLAMNLVDGDKEAIKLHLKSLNIDPMDLDMDTIDYSGRSTTASQEELVIEDVMERAKSSGIEDRVRQVVGKDWDAESFNEFVKNPSVRDDLLKHIETGAYDNVQEKIAEMSRLDYNGSFGSLNTISKYREAVKALQSEAPKVAPVAPKVAPAAPKPSVNTEKAKIEQARKEREYKAEAAKQEALRMEQRKRATSSSKSKGGSVKNKVKFDPMKVEGEELDSLMDFLISGGR